MYYSVFLFSTQFGQWSTLNINVGWLDDSVW